MYLSNNLSGNNLLQYTLYLADSSLILAQRNSEWCAHGPILEQDIAITNITLDLIGQSRYFYQYAAEMINASDSTDKPVTEDSLAYLRTEREFKNCLIVELPNGDWASTVLRQHFFSAYQYFLYQQLISCNDQQIAAIAEKSLKEVTYHLKWSSEWVIRLGDGTEESNRRINKALTSLWMYTGEFFMPAYYETIVDLDKLKINWIKNITTVFEEATLSLPPAGFMQSGGKTGIHTEHLGFILTELQYLQRAYPGAEW